MAVKIDKVQRGVKNHSPQDRPEDVFHCVFEGDHLDGTCDLRCEGVESDDGSRNVEGNVKDVCEEDEERLIRLGGKVCDDSDRVF